MDQVEEARKRLIVVRETMKIEDVAERSRISIGWLSQFQRGKVLYPNLRTLNKLLDFLRDQGA